MGNVTVEQIAAAARRGAVSIATDPDVKFYSPSVVGLIYESTIHNLAGAGDLLSAAAKIAADPKLTDVPIGIVEEVVAISFKHFARALEAVS